MVLRHIIRQQRPTTADKLLVIPLACDTSSSFNVRLTGRLRTELLCIVVITHLLCAYYAHWGDQK